MMSATPIDFDSLFTAELIDDAATSFVRHYLLARYGLLFVLACIINAAGFALSLWLRGSGASGAAWMLTQLFDGAVVILGPIYLAYVYFGYPRKFAARLKQRLLPTTHFSLSPEAFGVRTRQGSIIVPWARVKSILEFPSYFLLVLTPFAFTVIPKIGLPPEAFTDLEERGRTRVRHGTAAV